jgi:MoaA/NifB/PqqE/SkfB family radical SAM enzyme
MHYPVPHTYSIEPTTLCNAGCPMCPRADAEGHLTKGLRLQSIPRQVITAVAKEHPKYVYFCGNYGEPALYKDIFWALDTLRESGPMHLGFITNGSVHSVEWWRELCTHMGKDSHAVFSLDGLEDTHDIYRRNTSYTTVERNMRAFIDAGGEVDWNFLVFKHNEHQVDEARERAKRFGAKFILKRTSRFMDIDGKLSSSYPMADGKSLEIPTDEALVNSEMLQLTKEDFQSYLNTTKVSCRSMQEGSVYVTADGTVYPCCWTGLTTEPEKHGTEKIVQLTKECGNQISLLHNSISDIVRSPLFQKVVDGWDKNLSCGRAKVCSFNCGTHNKYAEQYKDAEKHTL